MTRARVIVLSLALVIAGLSILPSGASAAKVANPGAFTANVQDGLIRIKQQVFTFDQNSGIQFNGTVNANGDVAVPPSGVIFPSFPLAASGFNLTVSIRPADTAGSLQPISGNINPLTGVGTIRLRVWIKIDGVPFGGGCRIASATAPIDVNALITGTTNPPGPNTPITGVPYNISNGTLRVVNNSFSVPASSDCGLAAGTVDGELGLPSASGNNEAQFTLATDPILQRAINPSFTATPSSGEDPLNVSFNAAGTSSSRPVASYQWDFTNNGSFDATGVTTSFVYTEPGTYTARLRVTDDQGDFADTTRTITVTQAPPDLAINKSHTGDFRVGSPGVYTIQVDSTRGRTTGATTVTDTLPAGLTYVSATGTGWSCNAVGQDVTCTRAGTLSAGQDPPPITLTVNPTAAALPSVTNTATVSTAGDPDASDNSDSDPTNVTATDVTIDKSHTGTFGNFPVGPNSYSIDVDNEGTAATVGTTTVTDTLPAGLTYSSFAGSGWSCSAVGQDVTCNYAASIPAGGSAPTLTLNVVAALDMGETARNVTNTASVATADDIDLSDNSDSDPTLILDAPDAAIDKESSTPTFTAASNGSYTLVVQNRGPQPTTGTTTVTDTLPAGLTYISATGSGWSCNAVGQDVTCDYAASLAPGETAPTITLTVNVGLAAIPEVTNTANVSTTGDPNAANDSDTETTEVRQIDLVLSKEAVGLFRVDRNAEFQFTVTNQGNSNTASQTTITDTLPAGVTFVSGSGDGWSCGAAGQVVTCTYDDPIAGAGGTAPVLSVIVALDSAAAPSVTNTATVTTDDDLIVGNNSDTTDPVNVIEQDLAITKSHTGTFDVGSTRTYTLRVDNVGTVATTPASTTTVTDTLPAGLTYVSATGGGWTCGAVGQDVTCTRAGSIAPESPTPDIQLQVSINASAAPSVSNTATVATTDDDRNLANDSSTDVAAVPSPDLTVQSTHTDPFRAGSLGTYSLVVSNDGDAPTAGSITLTDTLPAGLTYVSATGTGWDCDATGQVVTCERTEAIAGGSDADAVTLTVDVAASAAPAVDNSVSVSVPGEPVTTNNSDSDTTNVTLIDLAISLSGPASVEVGEDATYTVDVDNTGTAATFADIVVTDTLPAGLVPEEATGTGWACSITGQAVSCTRSSSLAAGGDADDITIRASVTTAAQPGPVTNTAVVATDDDVDATDDSDSVTSDLTAAPDLELGIAPRNPINGGFRVGTDGAYRLTTRNVGGIPTTTATTITVTLPAGFTAPASFTDGDWSCTTAGQVVTCTLPSSAPIDADESVSVDVPFSVGSSAPASSVANAGVANAEDDDASNNNASTTLPVTRIDLAVDQSAAGDMTVGTQGALSLDVDNLGSAATISQTTVTQTLPAGVTYSSASGSGWSCSASLQTVTCNRADQIPAGGSAPLLTIRVDLGSASAPSFSVTSSVDTADDVAAANDSDTSSVAVSPRPTPPVDPPVTLLEKPVDVAVKRAKATLNGFITLALACPADSQKRCAGSVSLRTKNKVRTVKGGKKRFLNMGSVGYTVAAGRTFPAQVRLSKAAVKALKLTGRLQTVVTATASDKTVPLETSPLIATYDLKANKK